MGEISQISVGDETYEIKDSVAREKLDEVCVNTLHILFCDPLGGQTYSVTGGSESYEGEIPNSTLDADLALLGHNTKYTVSVEYDGVTYKENITTGPYFDHYNLIFMPFEVASWLAISRASDSGEASSYWAIGDRKPVELNGTVGCLDFDHETYYAYIIGFDHNAGFEGNHRIHMQFGFNDSGKHIAFIDDAYGSGAESCFAINPPTEKSSSGVWYETVDYGGWEASYMRNTICDQFKNVLPQEVQYVLKSVKKYTANVGVADGAENSVSEVTPTDEYIFLLSEYETVGSQWYANPYEQYYQSWYAYYQDGNSREMYKHTSTSSGCYWWLRSDDMRYSNTWCMINSDGNVTNISIMKSYGFAPAFTV